MTKEINKAASAARPTRTPVGARKRLSVPNQEPGYVYRIVNDLDDRVQQLLDNGYEIVPNAKVGDKRVDLPSALGSASTVSVGQGIKGVVMRQRQEFYTEDQATKQLEVDKLEGTMKSDARKAADYGNLNIT